MERNRTLASSDLKLGSIQKSIIHKHSTNESCNETKEIGVIVVVVRFLSLSK